MKPLFYYVFSWIRKNKIIKHIKSCERLLDVGCGEEYYLLKSLRKKVHHLYGVDSNVKQKMDCNIFLKKEHIIDKLNYPSNFFDYVIMAAVLEHLERPIQVLQEAFRVLRINGELILTTPEPKAEKILSFLRLFKLSELEEDAHKYYFSKEDLQIVLSDIGYKSIHIHPFELGLNNLIIARKELVMDVLSGV